MYTTDWQDPTSTATARNEQIAAMHREHARQLERWVERRARASPETIEDACSFAWLQLLTHTCIDLDAPTWRALGWLMQTATREAWRLEARRRRDGLLDHVALERELGLREQTAHGADEIVAQRERLELIAQIPERPRRFLLRLALGYGYRELSGGGERQPHDHQQPDRAEQAAAARGRSRRGSASCRHPACGVTDRLTHTRSATGARAA